MVGDYISRAAADAAIKAAADDRKAIGVPGEQAGFLQAHDIVRNLPAADVVEVVKCGECVEWQSGWKPSGAKEGTHFCAVTGLCKEANWFCADGERKDGGQDDV